MATNSCWFCCHFIFLKKPSFFCLNFFFFFLALLSILELGKYIYNKWYIVGVGVVTYFLYDSMKIIDKN